MIKEIIKKFPEPYQDLIRKLYSFIPYQLRKERLYFQMRKFLEKSQWWDLEAIQNFQLNKLKEIVQYAFENVPAYQQLYKEAGVRPEDIRKLEDIKYLPFVSKELIRDNLKDFTSKSIPTKKLIYSTTGGSTGIPFGFFNTAENSLIELAFIHTSWSRVGFRPGDRSAVLRGAFIGSMKDFYKFIPMNNVVPIHNELLLSSYYLTEETYSEYKKIILKYQPKFLQAYPSAATLLADLIKKNQDIGVIKFQAILAASENLYDWQKKFLEEVFKTRVFAFYGHAEKVILAPMCEYSDEYHIWPEYGYTEILNQRGENVHEGEIGELVGTSFWIKATPFIRYRTMDLAEKGKEKCDKCGRYHQLLRKIEGRLQELIITKTGRYISMTAINFHSDVFDNVKQFQFYQEKPGELILNLVKKESYTERDTDYIKKELYKKLGEDVNLSIRFVNSIPRTPSGKFRFLIQKLPIKYSD